MRIKMFSLVSKQVRNPSYALRATTPNFHCYPRTARAILRSLVMSSSATGNGYLLTAVRHLYCVHMNIPDDLRKTFGFNFRLSSVNLLFFSSTSSKLIYCVIKDMSLRQSQQNLRPISNPSPVFPVDAKQFLCSCYLGPAY